jgi:hypothetical protein
LERLGIRSIFYLDDILILGSSFNNCLGNLMKALSLLIEAGFIIDWEKSSLALPCRLDDFRRCMGINSISDRSFHLVKAGWRKSTEERYERAWQSFKDFLRPSFIPFHQASLKDVTDYLAHLYDRKISWSTICIHRSAISMTLAPIDGVPVGEHPIVKRLMDGVFNERPPRQKAPTLWDPQGS